LAVRREGHEAHRVRGGVGRGRGGGGGRPAHRGSLRGGAVSLERERLTGIAASPGVAIGRVTVFDRRKVPVPRRRVASEEIEREVARLEAAVEAARREVEAVRDALPADA